MNESKLSQCADGLREIADGVGRLKARMDEFSPEAREARAKLQKAASYEWGSGLKKEKEPDKPAPKNEAEAKERLKEAASYKWGSGKK